LEPKIGIPNLADEGEVITQKRSQWVVRYGGLYIYCFAGPMASEFAIPSPQGQSTWWIS
jgi:hypothetical protein